MHEDYKIAGPSKIEINRNINNMMSKTVDNIIPSESGDTEYHNVDNDFRQLAKLGGVIKSKDNQTQPAPPKFDDGKLFASLPFIDFPLALINVAEVGTYGIKKYSTPSFDARGSWRTVPNALQRYQEAFYRHLMAMNRGELVDPESGLLHASHALWNDLAVNQLRLENK